MSQSQVLLTEKAGYLHMQYIMKAVSRSKEKVKMCTTDVKKKKKICINKRIKAVLGMLNLLYGAWKLKNNSLLVLCFYVFKNSQKPC